MNFKHNKNLSEAIDGMKKIFSISWSPNLLRLAVAHVDERKWVRISLYDENGEKKEMFQTKPANKNSKYYVVKEIAFSPDSTKLAVSQSDCIIFVYNLGRNWGDRKVICNKFEQNSSITSMIWPNKKNHELFFGIADGKVKRALLKNNSAQILYVTGSFVVSMSYSEDNNYLISCHLDKTIYMFNIETNNVNKICTTNSVSYCLTFLKNNKLLVSSLEKIIYIYNTEGDIVQKFDYSKNDKLKEFIICKINSNFDLVALGNYNYIYIYSYNLKTLKWEDSCIIDIPNYYSITALCWKQDFGILVTGSLCGSLDIFESCIKKIIISNFEISYISLSQVLIKNIENDKRMTIKTTLSPEINKVSIENNNFVIINTKNSLIIGDLTSQKFSEIPWNLSGEEKFDVNNYGICLVYVNGEIAVIEFGNNEIVGYFRTDFSHPNLISAKIEKKKDKNIYEIAYLIDRLTIYIQDLISQNNILSYTNDSDIEFLEFNKTGNKIIFRDKKRKLNLLKINENKKITLIINCNFVQWVPNTQVLIAQNHKNLYVWYNIDIFLEPKIYTINGNVENVQRKNGKIEVNYIDNQEGIGNKLFLDENLVNLSIAIEERELNKAISILNNLSNLTNKNELVLYYKILAKISIEEQNLYIAQKCFATLGNYSKIYYLKKIIKEKEKNPDNPIINAKLLLLQKEFEKAEELMIKNNMIKEIIDICKDLHKYEEALRICKEFGLEEYQKMKEEYLQWLIESEMFDKAAELKIKENSYIEAIKFLIQGDMQVKAVNLILEYKVKVDKNTIDYLKNSINEIGMNELSDKLDKYWKETNNL